MTTDLNTLKLRMRQSHLIAQEGEQATFWPLVIMVAAMILLNPSTADDDSGNSCGACTAGCEPGCYGGCVPGNVNG